MLYDSDVVRFLSEEFVYTKVDIQADSLLAKKYSVLVTPTMIMLDSSGREVDRMGFYVDKDRFLQTFRDFGKGIGTLASLEQRATDSISSQLAYDIGERYMLRNDAISARKWYNQAIDLGKPTDSLTAECLVSMADIEYRRKNYNAAIAGYDSLAIRFPGGYFEEMALYYRGYMYNKLADTTKSLLQWEEYLDKFPKGVMADYAREQVAALKPAEPSRK